MQLFIKLGERCSALSVHQHGVQGEQLRASGMHSLVLPALMSPGHSAVALVPMQSQGMVLAMWAAVSLQQEGSSVPVCDQKQTGLGNAHSSTHTGGGVAEPRAGQHALHIAAPDP